MSDKLNKTVRQQILARDSRQCQKCHQTQALEVHHISPRWLGGSDDPDNLTTLCTICHAEWHMVEIGYPMAFGEWLALPTYDVLLAGYLGAPPEIRHALDVT